MAKQSAGLLLFRGSSESIEVLLVHPGGPFWARRDDGAWSIPKGEIAPGEEPLAAALREFEEETGHTVTGEFLELEPVKQHGGKTVFAWAVRGEVDPAKLRSSTFRMEWPPRSGQQREFPEVDRAAWFPIDHARQKILAGQTPLLEQLRRRLQAA